MLASMPVKCGTVRAKVPALTLFLQKKKKTDMGSYFNHVENIEDFYGILESSSGLVLDLE